MKPTKLTYEEVLVIDKITYEAKITDFELRNTPTGRQYFWDSEFGGERLTIKDGLQFICDAACYGFDFALEFGLTQQEIDTWNAMIDRFGLSDEFKAEDYKEREILHAKESTRKQTMKKLNITKEQFEKSKYFKNKYGTLEYVSESGKVFKTNKGKILMFKESGIPEWEIVKKGPDEWEEWEGDADERASFNVDRINDRKLWVKIMNCIRAFNDDKLYEAVTMPNRDDPDGRRQPNWDFIKAIEKAQWAITKELQANTDDNLIFLSDITKHISMNDLAQRLVDYVIEKQPTKSIARRLKKIGY